VSGDSEVEALQGQVEGMAVELANLRGELQQAVADGVADGLRAVMQDPDAIAALMDAVVSTAQQRAAQQAGQALFGVIKTVLSKWLVIGAIVLLVLKVAGADVAGKVWKLLTGGAP
jgi:hypothetical protein